MILSGTFRVLSKFSGKSKFDFWTSLLPGHHITITMRLENTGSHRGQMYAPTVTLRNVEAKTKFSDSLNSIANYLNKIELMQVPPIESP